MSRYASRPRVRLVQVEKIDAVVEGGEVIGDPKDGVAALRRLLAGKDREHFVALHLNARNRIVSAEVVSIGTLTSSLVHPREVFKGAILANANAIVCGHNHPSGDVWPSAEDQALEQRLTKAGELLGIPVLDFIIVTEESSWSSKMAIR